ncbi:MAG TPA: hypothetical protein DG754_07590 [Bacteroidales bacterium]|nr:hypothetical protein [Bacteroidales bacterium]
MIRLLFISLLFVSYTRNTNELSNTAEMDYKTQVEQVYPDTLLMGIESKIYEAFVQSLMQQDHKPLLKMSNELEELSTKEEQGIIIYWRSYLQFYSSIYFLKKGERKIAEKEIDKGIDWLTEIQKKNSEDYALLAMLQGFSVQFKGAKARYISDDIKESAKQALAIDSTNLRAYYVFASNNFYAPEKYGISQEVEKHLLKAISLPAQKVQNSRLPSWGKEESFEMIIKLYIREEKWDLAKKYYQEAIAEFPESYTINQLAAKLVGN